MKTTTYVVEIIIHRKKDKFSIEIRCPICMELFTGTAANEEEVSNAIKNLKKQLRDHLKEVSNTRRIKFLIKHY